MKKTWKCWIGWHTWGQFETPAYFGDTRTCECCGEVEKLIQDGIWNTGDWIPVRYLGEEHK